MGDVQEFATWPHQKHVFYEINSEALCVDIKGGEATIGLAKKISLQCDYWITIGEGDNFENSYISMGNEKHIKLTMPNTLSNDVYKSFVISWHSGVVQLQARSADPPQMISLPNEIQNIKYVTFFVNGYQRPPVYWRFEMPPLRPARPLKEIKGGDLTWVSSSQISQLPDNVLIGGFEKEALYIIRANHRQSLTPGKFVPSLGAGFISWGGQSHEKNEFEVLCGHDAQWVPAHDDAVPVGAVLAGHAEEAHEPLYVGRAEHEGHTIPGKIQPSHKVCYIPYEGREIPKRTYEALVIPFGQPRVANKTMLQAFKNIPRFGHYLADESVADDTSDSD